jgi:hypothetical protein
LSDIQLVGILRSQPARQPTERAQRGERSSGSARLLRRRRQQGGARRVLQRQRECDRERHQRSDERDDRDLSLAFADPGQQVDQRDRQARVVRLVGRLRGVGRQVVQLHVGAFIC